LLVPNAAAYQLASGGSDFTNPGAQIIAIRGSNKLRDTPIQCGQPHQLHFVREWHNALVAQRNGMSAIGAKADLSRLTLK
jgi:hypothetical protein